MASAHTSEPCRFGVHCSRKGCWFKHLAPRHMDQRRELSRRDRTKQSWRMSSDPCAAVIVSPNALPPIKVPMLRDISLHNFLAAHELIALEMTLLEEEVCDMDILAYVSGQDLLDIGIDMDLGDRLLTAIATWRKETGF